MRMRKYIVLVLALVVGTGCSDLTSPSFNDPSTEELTGSPNQAAIAGAVIGLVQQQRGMTSGFVEVAGIFGREGYDLRPEEPRTITQRLIDPLQGSAGFWGAQYDQMQNAFVLLDAIEGAPPEVLSDAEKSAAAGFVKTFMAEAIYEVALMHDPLPIPLDVNRAPTDDLAPLESIDAAYQWAFDMFDEAASDLSSGGGSFPFELPAGFTGFDTPATFLMANRALKVRALKYQDRWSEVLSTLPQTFVDAQGDLDAGVYFDHSTQSGDAVNTFAAQRGTNLWAHPRLWRDAELQASGEKDQRALDKISPADGFTLLGITVSEVFDVYTSLSDPIPWIQNEELVLIRAEANLATGNESAAIADINTIRERSGGLEPIPDPYDGDLLGQLLYEKRYSLMWEGGFTYLDAMQYGRTADTPDELPRVADNHVVYPRYPYPDNECLARGIESDEGCQPVFGF